MREPYLLAFDEAFITGNGKKFKHLSRQGQVSGAGRSGLGVGTGQMLDLEPGT
jgi:hypothetical protein